LVEGRASRGQKGKKRNTHPQSNYHKRKERKGRQLGWGWEKDPPLPQSEEGQFPTVKKKDENTFKTKNDPQGQREVKKGSPNLFIIVKKGYKKKTKWNLFLVWQNKKIKGSPQN